MKDGHQAAVVPFGKYKGQPLEVLRADQGYLDWLMAQDWFRERHRPIYQIIVNNFGEASETPEHNALQAKFLDEGFCRALLLALQWQPMVDWGTIIRRHYRYDMKVDRLERDAAMYEERVESGKKLEAEGWPDAPHYSDFCYGAKEARSEKLRAREAEFEAARLKLAEINTRIEDLASRPSSPTLKIKVDFEVDGWDVRVITTASDRTVERFPLERTEVLIEIKPSLGDDYPGVLRQMKVNSRVRDGARRVLVFDQFTASGATLEQVRAIFGASGFAVLSIGMIALKLKSSGIL